MRCLIRGALSGTLFFFLCSIMYSCDDWHDYSYTAFINDYSVVPQQKKFGFRYSFKMKEPNFTDSCRLMTPLEEKIYMQQQVTKLYVFKKQYGMGPKQFDQLMSNQWSMIVLRLMQTELGDEVIWNLWQAYKKKRIWDFGWKNDTKYELQKALKKRHQQNENQKKQTEEELQEKHLEQYRKFIEQQGKAVQDLYFINDLVFDEIEQAREDALEQSDLEEYMQYDQLYELDAVTRGYLLYEGISSTPYLTCYGTALQQQYHKEICDILTQVAYQKLNFKNRLQRDYQSLVLEHATNFAQAAQQTNQRNWMSVTGALSSVGQVCIDLCKELYKRPLDYARAMGVGVIESAYDLGHMMLRFDKAICSLGQMLYFLLETGAMTEAAIRFPESNVAALQKRYDQISVALSAMKQEFVNKDGPGRLKSITKFGADFYLPAKMTHAIGCLIGGICSRARGMRNLEGISSLLDESLITAETAEKIREIEIATDQGFTQKIATEFMEADSTVGKVANIIARPLSVILDEIKSLGEVIPYHRKDLLNEAREVVGKITKEFNGKINKDIMNKYRERTIIKDGIKLKEKIDIEHILEFKCKFVPDRRSGGMVLDIKGGHLPGGCEQLEELGLVKITSKELLPTGAIKYTMKGAITKGDFTKTVFPQNWTQEKIIKAAWEVYENPIGVDILSDDKICHIRNGIVDNFEMSIVLKNIVQKQGSKNLNINNITTALPYRKVKT